MSNYTSPFSLRNPAVFSFFHVLTRTQHRRNKYQWCYLFSTYRKAIFLKHKQGIVTCHVAVHFQRPQRSTAIGIYPVVVWGLAQVFVCFTGRLIDGWKERPFMSSAPRKGPPQTHAPVTDQTLPNQWRGACPQVGTSPLFSTRKLIICLVHKHCFWPNKDSKLLLWLYSWGKV